jgi:hypothetical protein
VGEETVTPEKAMDEVPHALELSSRGRNAFYTYRRDQLRETAMWDKNASGATQTELRRYLGLQNERSLRRELAKLKHPMWGLFDREEEEGEEGTKPPP